jgi:ABC-type bacteriocin/lantibiotic exporter with double-glycine peptidase domain
MKRLQSFLVAEEKIPIRQHPFETSSDERLVISKLELTAESFTQRDTVRRSNILESIDLCLKNEEFAVISGRIGSGKSMFSPSFVI